MATFYIKNNQIEESHIKITGNDVKHIKQVLRYDVNDIIDVCNEDGIRYKVQIQKYLENDEIICEIKEIIDKKLETPYEITIFQGIPKSDKMELIIQKGTELGVNCFIPVKMERSVVKINDGNENKKIERWTKIASEAAKQCGRQKLPIVDSVINFENIIENISKYDIVLVPYESEQNISIKQVLKSIKGNIASIAIVIGPEGGFSDNEINGLVSAGAKVCTLGPRILRTETAGIATISMINYELELL